MNITRGETKILLGTVATVAVVLLGGVWASIQNKDNKESVTEADALMAAQATARYKVGQAVLASTRAGWYRLQLLSKTQDRIGWTIQENPNWDIELKPNSHWILHNASAKRGIYSISGHHLIFFYHQGNIKSSYTLRLTDKGFTGDGNNPFFLVPTQQAFRYVKTP